MASMSLRQKPSTLKILAIISVLAGIVSLGVSSWFLDKVIQFRGTPEHGVYCKLQSVPVLKYLCTIAKRWYISGILGVIFSILQILGAAAGILIIETRWKIWCGAHAVLFLSVLFTFSWAANNSVDGDISQILFPSSINTQAAGQSFLAVLGLDFIFIFSAILYVLNFGRKNTATLN